MGRASRFLVAADLTRSCASLRVVIEISGNPDSFGAVIFHSTESGRFMAASRDELAGLIDAAKRGVFDAVVTGTVNSAAAWTAEQVAENEAWERDRPEARPKPWPGA